MAEAATSDNKNRTVDMKTLKERIMCRVCGKQYSYPKTLSCLHSFCISCLRSLSTLDSKGTKVVCPTCKMESLVPDNDFEAFPEAFHIKREIQLYEFLQKANGRIEIACEKCSNKTVKAASYCPDCSKFICDLCVTIHRSWPEFQSHKVLSLAKLRSSSGDHIPEKIEPLVCVVHTKECTIFCETCQEQICHECIIKAHRDHHYNLAHDAAVKHKESLSSSLSTIEDIPKQLQLAIDKINSISKEFSAKGQAVMDEVKTRFGDLQKQALLCCEELLKDAQEVIQSKQVLLNEQRKDLESMKAKATDCLEFIQQATEGKHIAEFFMLEHQMASRIKTIKAEFEALDLTPIEEPEIQFFLQPELAEKIKTESRISDGSVLYAGATEGKYFSVNEIITFYIALSSAFYKCRSSPIEQFKAEIQSCRDDSICPATIAISSSGFAKLQCSFSERGRYRVNVLANGRHITGSPYAFYVKPPPQQFQAPVKTITNLSSPRGIAVNHKNQIVITEENRHVVTIYGRKSKKILSFGSFGSQDSQFNQPLGVVVDGKGFIYIADSKNDRLQKFGSDGSLVAIFSGEKEACGVLSRPSSVKVDKEDFVYMVDRGNSRVIVLDSNLDYQFDFGGHGVGLGQLEDPWDIALDAHGFVYVTDIKQHCIHIFSAGGEFRGRIGSHGTQKGKLNRPTGIAIDRFNRIFVSESANHRVSMFHVCSEFLDCFSTGLTMVNPCGIALDNDGFVYVTSSDSVHVF